MKLSIQNILFPLWNRNSHGENFYDITSAENWYASSSNLEIAREHPILTPAILFVAKLFSQAKFTLVRKSTGAEIKDHYILDIFNKPNYYQTLPDLLESLLFTQIANGVGVLYIKRTLGFNHPESLFVLNYALIKFPEGIEVGNLVNKHSGEKKLDVKIKYDEGGEDLDIKLSDLMFFYDLPNALHKNPHKATSRIEGLKQTLINTKDSLIAKNIILRTNGKELLSGTKDGFPLSPDEKKEAERLFNSNYGLSASRKRGLITKASVTYKSLHIALRDLGLDESVKVDGNIIYTAMHIPKDIISLEAKKTTYNNFKESMVSYLQNEIQPTLDSFIAIIYSKLLSSKERRLLEIKGDYEHLPIMQFILIERYEVALKRAIALKTLREAGLPNPVALDLVGLDNNIELSELITTTNSDSANDSNNEEEVKAIIDNYLELQMD